MALTEEHLIHVPGLQSRWVRLATGAKAHYSTAGDTGPAIILLHGAVHGSSGHAGWRFMAPFLGEHGFRVFCPDLPHYGLTENHVGVYAPGFAGGVDFVHDFANALCLDEFNIGGNSNGSCVAMSYTVNHPDRVLKMGMIVSRGLLGLIDEEAMKKADPRTAVERGFFKFDGTKESMLKMIDHLVHFPDRLSDELVEMRTYAANRNLSDYAKRDPGKDPNYLARIDIRGRIQRLQMPAIYVCGQDDVTSTVAISNLQEDALTNFQVFYPAETGHQGQSDQPELFNQLFLEFFRDGKVSRQTADAAGVSKRRPERPDLVEQI